MDIGIIGGGMTGLFAARALARSGHRMTVFEPDALPAAGDADEAFLTWKRPGVAQLRQPHSARAFIVLALQRTDPELLERMLAAGMFYRPWYLPGADGTPAGRDPDLVGLHGRRTSMEIPLREAVESTPGVQFRRVPVRGLVFDHAGSRPRVTGVVTDQGPLAFDAVLDTTGRGSKTNAWLQAAGIAPATEESVECGITYYTRHFRFDEGIEAPDFPPHSGFGPSAHLPGVHFTMNRTDHRTFSLMLAVDSQCEAYRALRHNDVHLEFVRNLPNAISWLQRSTPLRNVEPFAGLVNRYKCYLRDDGPMVDGLFVLGDARFYTNPLHAWGMSFGLHQVMLLVEALAAGPDLDARVRRFEQQADRYARSYFDTAAGEDQARVATWRDPASLSDRGEPGSYRYFITTILPATFKDPVIFRKVMRREHLIDHPEDVLRDPEVLRRAHEIGATVNRTLTQQQLEAMVVTASQVREKPAPATMPS